MYWHDGGWGAGSWVLMSVLMLVFWAAVVIGIVALVRSRPPAQHPHPWPPAQQQPPAAGPDMARRILDERFARGEIDEDEYRRRRDVLGGG